VKRWSPEVHAEVREMLTEFERYLVAELPQAPGTETLGTTPPSKEHA
jgi:hypothetical protein